MAVYHCTAKVVSRASGQSVIAKAAYNARDDLKSERTGERCDFSNSSHSAVLFSGIFAPKDAPDWARDREQLWNRVEAAEKRKDAQLAREIEIALPHELTDEQRKWLVTDFVRENFLRKGMVADVNSHAPDKDGDPRNFHAHILLTMRYIGPDGFGEKAREWNSRQELGQWRENWANLANRYLERFGHEARIDHRSLVEQGIAREPGRHRGPELAAMERRGEHSDVLERLGREDANKDDLRERATLLIAELLEVEQTIIVVRREPEPLSAREAIREAYERSDSAVGFKEALAEQGLFLARADNVDAHGLQIEASHARTRGAEMPETKAGDFVAVDTRGNIWALTDQATGDSPEGLKEFLAPLGGDPAIDTVANTRAEFAAAAESLSTDPRLGARGRDDMPAADRLEKAVSRIAEFTLDKLADLGSAALDKAADLLGGARQPLTPQERGERAASEAYRAWKAAVAAADRQSSTSQSIDRERWMSDAEYRKQVTANERVAAAREIEERLRREREEQSERSRRIERER